MNTATVDEFPPSDFRQFRRSSSEAFPQHQHEEATTARQPEKFGYHSTTVAGQDTLTVRARIADFESLNLKARIYSLVLPARMREEGVAPPTVTCRDKAATIAFTLYSRSRIIPERVSPNVEEGISIVYRNHLADKTLVIEVYNTTEIAALLNQSKTILAAEDLKDVDDPALDNMVVAFKAVDISPTAQSKRT
jgi:hypothetical protein